MNKFVKDMLMSKYDKRNPYGSQGGYVDSRGYSSTDARQYSSNDTKDYRGEYYRGSQDYNEYDRGDYRGEYRGDMRGDYRGDYRYNDYRQEDYGEYGKLSRKDVEMWGKSLMNADGTKGQHFHMEQLEPIIKRTGVRVEQMGGMETFAMVVNMMYADYCDVAKKFGLNTPDFYVHMAKAFLEDKDFRGNPEEKVWLYYKCIAEQE